MGGFLYLTKKQDESTENVAGRHRASMAVFEHKGLRLKDTIEGESYVLYVYDKLVTTADSVFRGAHSDFAVATGTFIYDGRMGAEALQRLHKDFSPEADVFSSARGLFCVFIAKGGKLYVFNDYGGIYHVYQAEDGSVLSSSLLAVVKSLPRKTVAEQELYEYVTHGAMYGDRTLFEEARLLDSFYVHQLAPERRTTPKHMRLPPWDSRGPFDELVEAYAEYLIDYYRTLQKVFGDSVCLGLSGGHDSRLMLSLMRRVGINPYVYVYGRPTHPDVRVSLSIGKGEGFSIEHEDRVSFPVVDRDRFAEQIQQQFYFYDGRGTYGAFDNGADMLLRKKRSQKGRLQINGGGGDFYRNFWRLPNKDFSVAAFIKAEYDRADFTAYTDRFDKRAYFDVLASKIKSALETSSDRLHRDQVELINPRFRTRYWQGPNSMLNNTLAFALMPLTDPVLAMASTHVPIRYKEHAGFVRALNRYVDPALAKYPSIYGYNFIDPLGWGPWTKECLKVHTPVCLRRFLRQHFLHRPSTNDLPPYISRDCLETIFDMKSWEIARYVDIERIRQSGTLRRALTVELLLTDRY